LDEDDVIPEDALEFNPDAADVNQVFVEPPPNPEWTAATGTFKAIVLKSEETSRGSMNSSATSQDSPTFDSLDLSAPEPPPLGSSPVGLGSSFGEDEFELDPDFLSATAEMRKLKIGLGDLETGGAGTSMGAGTSAGMGTAKPNTLSSQPPAPAQPPVPPSARLAPRGPLPDAPARASSAETQSRQQLKPPPAPLDVDTFFEPQVVSSRPPTRTAAVKAFGLDSVVEPPPERLAALARSRVAPSGVELETEPPPTRLVPNLATLWSAGSGALVILLAAQIVNHYRNDIAATAQFNKPITALYAALGVHLTPRWDLHAYDVRQLGASVDSASAGQIMVRASVKNGAHQPQPMPLLRVTLQDRFGNRIAARDVPPGSYLPRATAATAFLPAGQRIDAEMAFVDPGSNAVGFEIDACLPAPAGGIACANDPAAR
jgi:hypothetical protein